jgi:hypothetical protein
MRAIWFVCICAPHIVAAVAAGQTIQGSSTSFLPAQDINVQAVPSEYFPHFVESALKRFFHLSDSDELVSRSARTQVQDVQVSGLSLDAPSRTRGPWQRFRFEVMYTIDEAWLKTQKEIRYNILVRILSGQFADWNMNGNPPSDRIKELSEQELTDLARRFTAFLLSEVNRECFEKELLKFCDLP